MEQYLCYDLKGIQQYIFQVPKLTCCIGGSRQIDGFDHQALDAESSEEVQRIYSGGGKGAFLCKNDAALSSLKQELIGKALAKGLTIRFGIDADYLCAAREIRETYCYQPDSLEGHPCPLSGLYPTTDKEHAHPLIEAREKQGRQHGKESPTEAKFLEILKEEFGEDFSFFYNVDPADFRGRENTPSGAEGAAALGNRNRWAVICMDGNDMGLQFLEFQKKQPRIEDWQKWLPEMSKNLDKCTREAAAAGMIAVTREYLKEEESSRVLPIRPLIVGGDDVTILISCKYAILFAQTVMNAFNEASKKCKELWVGTRGEMTISAGILYAPVSLPLHSALGYAEMLLASAKTHGRELKKQSGSACSPACLDWESVTEGLLLSPAARREKEFKFMDPETKNEVELTARPYSMGEFKSLLDIKKSIEKLPNTVLYQLHPGLLTAKENRMAFYARLCKNHPSLVNRLMEPLPGKNGYGEWWEFERNIQRTKVIDAVLLLQEEMRMEQETILNEEED